MYYSVMRSVLCYSLLGVALLCILSFAQKKNNDLPEIASRMPSMMTQESPVIVDTCSSGELPVPSLGTPSLIVGVDGKTESFTRLNELFDLLEVNDDRAVFRHRPTNTKYNANVSKILVSTNGLPSEVYAKFVFIDIPSNPSLGLKYINTTPDTYVNLLVELGRSNVTYEPDWEIELTAFEFADSSDLNSEVQIASLNASPDVSVSSSYLDYWLITYNDWQFVATGMVDYKQTISDPKTFVVAVVDTGIDLSHPQLVDSIFTNEGEIPNNGIDDDNNGYIDDVNGWDFVNSDNDPSDDHVHGTHVAGTIAAHDRAEILPIYDKAVTSPAFGVVKLLPLKCLDATGNGYNSTVMEALSYASDFNDVLIYNHSWGGPAFSPVMLSLINSIGDTTGAIQVCAAGNESVNNDSFAQYPANYDSDYVLSVAAADVNGDLAGFSNFGNSVDIAAPGAPVLSTVPSYPTAVKTQYAITKDVAMLQGTSMATPTVTTALALIRSNFHDVFFDPIKPIDILLESSVNTDLLVNNGETLDMPVGPTVTTSVTISDIQTEVYEDLLSYAVVKFVREGDLSEETTIQLIFPDAASPLNAQDVFPGTSTSDIVFAPGQAILYVTYQISSDPSPSVNVIEQDKLMTIYGTVGRQKSVTIKGYADFMIIDSGYPAGALPVPEPDGDNDQDGLCNLLEHSFAMDPNGSGGHAFQQSVSPSHYSASFGCPSRVSNLSFEVEYSTNLEDWYTETDALLDVAYHDEYTNTASFIVNKSEPVLKSKFYRIKPVYD